MSNSSLALVTGINAVGEVYCDFLHYTWAMSQLAFQFEVGEQYGWIFLFSSHSTRLPVLILKLHVPASVLYYLSDCS